MARGVAASTSAPTPTEAVLTAKFWAAEGGWRVVHAAHHLHGGFGVDRDYPLHRYFLLMKHLELQLGSATPEPRRPRRSARPRLTRTADHTAYHPRRWRPAHWRQLPDEWSTGLAIVAHPDDLEYGAASAIAKWTDAGKTIHYLLVTRGEAGLAIPPSRGGPLREAEERASAAVVGVDVVEFLDHRDGVVENTPWRSGAICRRAIRRHRPDVVIGTNFRDTWGGPSFNMADHRNVGLATLDAIRDAANPWIFPELLDEGHEPWDGVHDGVLQRVAAGHPLRRHRATGSTAASPRSRSTRRTSTTSAPTPAQMLTEFAEIAGPRPVSSGRLCSR